jgi:GNAT superfamily N-acetyltransferase
VLDSSFQDADGVASAHAAVHLRVASAADVPFIVDAIVAESRHGHFACDCSRPDVLRGLWHQVQAIVAEGFTPMPDARNGAGGRAFVVQVDSVNVAFAILVEHAPGSWYERIELFACATHEAFRGRGLARHLVLSLVRDSQSAAVYARCADASDAMTALLVSCGFAAVSHSVDGTTTLEFRRTIPPAVRG